MTPMNLSAFFSLYLSDLSLLFYGGAGLIAGFIGGLLGLGGAIILIPALLFLPPLVGLSTLPMNLITGLAAVQAFSGSISASRVHLRQKNLMVPLVLLLGGMGLIGSYLGGMATNWFSDQILKSLYMVMATSALVLFWRKSNSPHQDDSTPMDWARLKEKHHLKLVMVLCLFVGFISGILGVGGSIFTIPLTHSLLQLPPYQAVGTGSGTVFFIALASVVSKAQSQIIPWPQAMILSVAGLIGGHWGAKTTKKLPPLLLKILLSAIILTSIIRLALDVWAEFWSLR